MADAVEAWCKRVFTNVDPRILVIGGPFGCGKTRALRASRVYVRQCAGAMWPEYWHRPPSYCSVNWPQFVRRLSETGRDEAFDEFISGDVLFMDDVGAEEDRFKSGSPARILGDVLGAVADDGKFALLTTNISPDGWRERWDGRVEDRLLRGAEVVDLWALGIGSYSVWKLGQ